MNTLTPQPLSEEMRLLSNQLTPEERRSLRRTEFWETCFRSWLACEQTSEIGRTLALRPALDPNAEEEFLKSMDGKAILLFNAHLKGMDEIEMLESLFPYPEDWEDTEDEPPNAAISELAEDFFNRVTGSESSDPE
jgi:hypothetical protein